MTKKKKNTSGEAFVQATWSSSAHNPPYMSRSEARPLQLPAVIPTPSLMGSTDFLHAPRWQMSRSAPSLSCLSPPGLPASSACRFATLLRPSSTFKCYVLLNRCICSAPCNRVCCCSPCLWLPINAHGSSVPQQSHTARLN